MNLEKYLVLDLKKLSLIVLSFFAAVILHNAVYGLFNVEEAFFFIIAVFVVPAYFLVAVFYTIFHHVKHSKKKSKK